MSAWASMVIASRCIDCASGVAGWLVSEQALKSRSISEVAINLARTGCMASSNSMIQGTVETRDASVNGFDRAKKTPHLVPADLKQPSAKCALGAQFDKARSGKKRTKGQRLL